jgi:DNA sulfur modification protein DndC
MQSYDLKINTLFDSLVESVTKEYINDKQNYPWIIGFSGGKDSSLVAHIVFQVILNIRPSKRTRDIYIVSNDTLVESPLVVEHIAKQLSLIDEAAKNFNLPIKIHITRPRVEHTFWTLLIGKGYPSPNQRMRWCTDRLKIQPTSKFILNNISEHGAAIIVLGVRKDESSSRKSVIDKYKNIENSKLSPHSELQGAYIYRPISDVSTLDVWNLLSYNDPPWGGTHEHLIQLYRDAKGGECPMVLSKDEAPGCGTPSSRFGCWVCTVVEKDRSLQGFVDSGQKKYQILIDFRDWLKSIRNDPEHRQIRRRNGNLTFEASGKHIPGPFTISSRKLILEKLLAAQQEYGQDLISKEELDLIASIWAEELVRKNKSTGDIVWR